MRRLFLLGTFVLGNLSILVVAFLFLTIRVSRQTTAALETPQETVRLVQDSYDVFDNSWAKGNVLSAMIVVADGRPHLIDNFFYRYASPMYGLGKAVVGAADKYRLPFGLLPAIAQCEGNLGKSMPPDSFNPYGFGIYGERMTKFASWEEGIEIVSKILRTDYFDLGLDTPETMMRKYTPPSTGSWAYCVRKFMEELR